MKKIIFPLVILLIFFSCKKEKELKQPVTKSNVFISKKNNRISVRINRTSFIYKKTFSRGVITPTGNAGWIAFDSLEEYEILIDSLSENDKTDFVNTIKSEDGFFSLNDAATYTPPYTIVDGDTIYYAYDPLYDPTFAKDNADSVDNDFFGEILNPDGVVQISNYLFRVNAVTGYCYVMDSSYVSEDYSDLIAENTTNPHILEYSNDDDVLDILFGTQGQNRLFCSENGVPTDNDKGHEYYSTVGSYPQIRLECKVVYQKLAIYFALVSRMEYKFHAFIGWSQSNSWTWDAMTAYYQWKYKPKCKSETIQTATSYAGSANNNTYKLKPYESTRGLHKYDFQYQWGVTGDEATGHTYKLTSVYRIVHGY